MASCQVNIDGTDYFIPCDLIDNLHMIDGKLVNLGSSSITMKSSFAITGNTYPYIHCSSNSVCRYYPSNNQTYYAVTSAPDYEGDPFLIADYGYIICCLLILILGVRLIWKK